MDITLFYYMNDQLCFHGKILNFKNLNLNDNFNIGGQYFSRQCMPHLFLLI